MSQNRDLEHSVHVQFEVESFGECPNDDPTRWSVMLSAYLDESGQESKGLVIVAGFIGDNHSWGKCALAWREGFNGSQRKTLHLSDLKFKRQSEKKLLECLGPIPEQCGLKRISGSVNVADYYDMVERTVAELHAHGYSLSLVPLVLAIRDAIPEDECYELIFEEQTALGFYRDKLLTFLSYILANDPAVKSGTKKNQLISWKAMTKGQTRLFEPADYLCYHLSHNSREPGSIRTNWTKPIMGSGAIGTRHLTREACREIFSIAPSVVSRYLGPF
jgi:hypothetical protein